MKTNIYQRLVIKNHYLIYKGYKLKCCIGKSGLTNSKKEGDLSTPKGLLNWDCCIIEKIELNLVNVI